MNTETKIMAASAGIGLAAGGGKYLKGKQWMNDMIKSHSIELDGVKHVKVDPKIMPTVDEFVKTCTSQNFKKAGKLAGLFVISGALVAGTVKLVDVLKNKKAENN